MIIFFDLETQQSAEEVGGWSNVEAMRMSVGCTHDEEARYRDWWEAQAADLIQELHRAELIVGYNVTRFDYRVLSLYGNVDKLPDKTFDLLDEIYLQTGKRVALNVVAKINLGEAKILESGVQAISLWRTGRREELVEYCRRDVELTRRLYELWETRGILWTSYTNYVVWPGIRTAEDMEEREEEDE